MTESVHRHHRCQTCCITEVVLKLTACQFRTRCGLNGNNASLLSLADIATNEGETDTCEVRATTEATDNNIGLVASHLHLLDTLLADNGLVQQYVVHHTTQAITSILAVLQSTLHSLRDSHTEITAAIGILGQHLATEVCSIARRRDNVRTPRIHQQLTVRLLLAANLNHIDAQVDVKILTRKRNGATPLTATGLSCEVLDTLLGIVICLRNSRIGLMRTCGRNTLILEVNLRRRIQHTLQIVGTYHGRRTPNLIQILHLVGYLNITLCRELLTHQLLAKDAAHRLEGHGLLGLRIEARHRLIGHIGHNIIPRFGHLALG